VTKRLSQPVNKRYITILLIALVVLAVAITFAVMLAAGNRPGPASPGVSLPSPGATVTYEGKLACLPHKGDGPHTMECAFGLQLNDGRHLGLKDPAPNPTYIRNPTGSRLTVTGTFINDGATSKYDIIGSLNVTDASSR
jgi:hypothetical protein